jgi:hypothetical protein
MPARPANDDRHEANAVALAALDSGEARRGAEDVELHAWPVVPGASTILVREGLAPIFSVNGGGDEWVLVGGVPSYLHLFPESCVDQPCAAGWFRSAKGPP